MTIGRHFIDVKDRRVHYRMAGDGPPLLLIHQGPRSSAEMDPLIARWSSHFTCIAPDTPGFGLSTPLPDSAEIDQFADAIAEFLEAAGLRKVVAYGFHSGGVLLMNVLRRHPQLFTGIAFGGYALWTDAEQARFDQSFAPTNAAQPFGEHLVWLWNRVLEQTWFFPWFEAKNDRRLAKPHADPALVDINIRELLDSGSSYHVPFAATLRAKRSIAFAQQLSVPAIITAFDGDPLQKHLERLNPLPPAWQAFPVSTAEAQLDASFAFLKEHAPPVQNILATARDEGFVHIVTEDFDGLMHWKGDRNAQAVLLHRPAGSIETVNGTDKLCIDLPGHGLSDPYGGTNLDGWAAITANAIRAILPETNAAIIGEGISALLALKLGEALNAPSVSAIDAHIPEQKATEDWLNAYPDLTPDRYGSYLVRAWAMARAENLFWPWFSVHGDHATPFEEGAVAPDALAIQHRSIMRATGGKALLEALLRADRNMLVANTAPIASWNVADWAKGRADMWQPECVEARTDA